MWKVTSQNINSNSNSYKHTRAKGRDILQSDKVFKWITAYLYNVDCSEAKPLLNAFPASTIKKLLTKKESSLILKNNSEIVLNQ